MIGERDVAWYAVRCCCEPLKIFGFLLLDGRQKAHTIRDTRGDTHRVELRPVREICSSEYGDPPDVETQVRSEVAVYSDDRPIEFWRTIPGFLEVRSEDR